MATSGSVLSADQFQCPICLDVLSEPVSTPCGHNFCSGCIKRSWDSAVVCQCPLCKETFFRRPALRVNTTLREVAELVRTQRDSGHDLTPAQPGDVPCDICSGEGGSRLRALKSCLDCGTSFCALHLELHQRAPALQRHMLSEPLADLEGRVCQKHRRPLELFCRDDHMCVCQFCTEGEHKNHSTVPLEEEGKDRKSLLNQTQVDLKSMIQERQEKISEIKQSVELSRVSAEAEAASISELFSVLVLVLERSRGNLQGALEARQHVVETQANALTAQLEQEIHTLQSRHTQLEELTHTHDHLHLLQVYASMCVLPPCRSWSLVSVWSYQDVNSLRPLVSRLEGLITREMDDLHETQLKRVQQFTELSKVQQYAVDVTLDADSANAFLQLSEDRRQVCCGQRRQKLQDVGAGRFDRAACVLGSEAFAQRFYFQVAVGSKSSWDVGVASEAVTRKGKVKATPETGYWTVALRRGAGLVAKETNPVPLAAGAGLQMVGVFVDYPRGVVSFYDVTSMSHLYSFTGQRFTGRLRPLLSPGQREKGRNSAPLVISVDRPIT